MSILKIHHLNSATLRLRFARVFDGSRRFFDDRLSCVTHCLVVETSNAGLVLVDAGFSSREMNHPERISPIFQFTFRPLWKNEETALAYVRALGLEPRDVRYIILTHLDFDHAAGIADFPWATVHVYAPELQAARSGKSWRDRIRYDRKVLATHEHWESHSEESEKSFYGLRNIPLGGSLGEEFALIPLPGHSAGHCGVAVCGQNGWLVHAGDAYMAHDELEPAPHGPAHTGIFQPVMQEDGRARKDSLNLLSNTYFTYPKEVRVFCAHDRVEFEALAQLNEEGSHSRSREEDLGISPRPELRAA